MKISPHHFKALPSGHGHYRVTYESPISHKTWTSTITDMQLIDNLKSPSPNTALLNALKWHCKRS